MRVTCDHSGNDGSCEVESGEWGVFPALHWKLTELVVNCHDQLMLVSYTHLQFSNKVSIKTTYGLVKVTG